MREMSPSWWRRKFSSAPASHSSSWRTRCSTAWRRDKKRRRCRGTRTCGVHTFDVEVLDELLFLLGRVFTRRSHVLLSNSTSRVFQEGLDHVTGINGSSTRAFILTNAPKCTTRIGSRRAARRAAILCADVAPFAAFQSRAQPAYTTIRCCFSSRVTLSEATQEEKQNPTALSEAHRAETVSRDTEEIQVHADYHQRL